MMMKEYETRQDQGFSRAQLVLGGLGFLGGLWMIAAPFVLNYSGIQALNATTKKMVAVDLSAVTTSDIICGVLLIGLVGLAMYTLTNKALYKLGMYANLAVILVGVYLVSAPYLFDLLKVASYLSLDKPNTNDQLVGILTVIIAGFAFQRTYLHEEPTTGSTAQVVTTS
jgi:drug/metabolite transporter (DMT)-like permease